MQEETKLRLFESFYLHPSKTKSNLGFRNNLNTISESDIDRLVTEYEEYSRSQTLESRGDYTEQFISKHLESFRNYLVFSVLENKMNYLSVLDDCLTNAQSLEKGLEAFFEQNPDLPSAFYESDFLFDTVIKHAPGLLMSLGGDTFLKISIGQFTNISQPTNTCPMIDKAVKDLKFEITDLEFDMYQEIQKMQDSDQGEIDKFKERIKESESEIENIEAQIDELKEDEDSDNSDSIDTKRSQIEDIKQDIKDYYKRIEAIDKESDQGIDDFRSECDEKITNLENLIQEAEDFRTSCADTRDSGLAARDYIYSYIRESLASLSLSGKMNVFYSEEKFSPEFKEVEDFDYSKLSKSGHFGRALDNFSEICSWGNSFETLDLDGYLEENSIIHLDVAVRDLIDQVAVNYAFQSVARKMLAS